jgi:hypothetical protein
LGLQERFAGMRGVVMDPNAGGQQMAQLLEKGEHPLQQGRGLPPLEFFPHSQDNAPMALASSRLDEAIRGGEARGPSLRWVAEGDWEKLRRHVLNAVRRSLGGEKWKYDRPPDAKGERRRKFPIDALTGVEMGHSVAVAELYDSAPMPLVEVFG